MCCFYLLKVKPINLDPILQLNCTAPVTFQHSTHGLGLSSILQKNSYHAAKCPVMISKYQKDCTMYFSPCKNHVCFYITQVPAIQQKRTVAFLNQFVVHTVQFLNRFSTVCEEVGPVILVYRVA
jgi:hypothetical protein